MTSLDERIDGLAKEVKEKGDSPKVFIKQYKKLTIQHGLTSILVGAYAYATPKILDFVYDTGKPFSSKALDVLAIYFIAEGLTDILFRQRKHHILSSIFEFFGIDALSVPKASELRKRLYK